MDILGDIIIQNIHIIHNLKFKSNKNLLMKIILSLFTSLVFLIGVQGQSGTISGKLFDENSEPIMFANVILKLQENGEIVKVETSDENGSFNFVNVSNQNYLLTATYVGYDDLVINDLNVEKGDVNLGELNMNVSSVQLETAVITAQRALVEIKPDRTVFNVQGTVNSAGDNGLDLLRKAPGVLVDNNNNVSVLSRTGVMFYVDGKRLPLSGEDLSNYLQNIPAEQIDRIDIITNPGAKYEAQGNAGIIDIRLKKDDTIGYNGVINATGSVGMYARGNVGFSGNYRNKRMNVFGSVGANMGDFYNRMSFLNEQNGLVLRETNKSINSNRNGNVRIGTDFFLTKKSTLGFLINSNIGDGSSDSRNRSEISSALSAGRIDSVLVAENTSDSDNSQNTFNINYVYLDGEKKLNIDADYGRYRTDAFFNQPNNYFDSTEMVLFSQVLTEYQTPTDIDIYTFKADYETPMLGGQLGFGTKLSKVATANTFLFYNIENGESMLNDQRSNTFDYDENVYAGYVNYARQLSAKINMSAGLRVETTDATGDLQVFDITKSEPPVELNYTNVFPTAGLTYMHSPMHMWSVNYGRRINRPDYNVLNPFRIQLSELSFSKGNARLNPEIVNNVELGYTYQYMYNFKLAYSRTVDQITRLIGPDDVDPRAGFITWANLATQTIYSANISAPITINKWWSTFINVNAGYQDNRADYGEDGVVDVQAFNYNVYQQSTFSLPNNWKAEISGWYSGPGIWGGVFKYDPSYSINLGIQRKFFNEKLSVKLNVNDITFQSGWSGVSNFNGLRGTGRGNWDSRRATLSMSYNFGNNKIKSRNRKTGLEDETSRIGGE
jgi:hypothetical protein